jgi:hypothetical protein
MATVVVREAAPRPVGRAVGKYDRLFYGTIALATALTVLVGFAPTYYARFFTGGPTATISGGPFTPLVHLHGALFTTWVVLFLVQTALISSRRVAVHRRLGIAGALLAASMIAVGVLAAIAMAKRGGAPPGIPPLAFLAVPLFDMIFFGGFITAALLLRRRKEAHKRLMLLAYASLMAAPAARLPGVLALGPFAFYGIAILFIVAGAIYDLVSRGRVHPAYLWGGSVLVISVPLRLMLSGTAAWQAFARFVTS